MTDLVSLLFIAMIPIDFKITNFPYTCLFTFFVTIIIVHFFCSNYNIWWTRKSVTSATNSNERMTTDIIFACATPIKFICHKALYSHLLAPLHSAIDRGEHEKYILALLATIWKYGKQCVRPQDRLVKVKKRKSDYTSCSVLSNNLQNDLSKRIVC